MVPKLQIGKAEHGEGSTMTSSKLDNKEVSVWELHDNVTKLDFRHWLDAIDLQLEAIHGFAYPDLVLEKVKRFPTEINEAALTTIIKSINDEQAERKRKEESAEGSVPAAAPGLSGFFDPWAQGKTIVIEQRQWNFLEKTRWLYSYLVGKLNPVVALRGRIVSRYID